MKQTGDKPKSNQPPPPPEVEDIRKRLRPRPPRPAVAAKPDKATGPSPAKPETSKGRKSQTLTELIETGGYTVKLPTDEPQFRPTSLTDLHEDDIRMILSKLTLYQQLNFAIAYPQFTNIQSYQSSIKNSLALCYASTTVNPFSPAFLEYRHFYGVHDFDWISLANVVRNAAQKLWTVKRRASKLQFPNISQLTLFLCNPTTFPTDLDLLLVRWAPTLTDLRLVSFVSGAPLTPAQWESLADLTSLRHLSLELSTEQWDQLEETVLIGIAVQLRSFSCNLESQIDGPTTTRTAQLALTQFRLLRLLNPEVIQSIGLLGLTNEHLIELSDLEANFRPIWSAIRRVVVLWSPHFDDRLSANLTNFFGSLPLNVAGLQYLSIVFDSMYQSCFIFYLLGCLQGSRLTELSFSLTPTRNKSYHQFHLPAISTIPQPIPTLPNLTKLRLANFEVHLKHLITLMALFPRLRTLLVHYPGECPAKFTLMRYLVEVEGFDAHLQLDIQRESRSLPVVVEKAIWETSVKFYFPLKGRDDFLQVDLPHLLDVARDEEVEDEGDDEEQVETEENALGEGTSSTAAATTKESSGPVLPKKNLRFPFRLPLGFVEKVMRDADRHEERIRQRAAAAAEARKRKRK